jgi:hypothetical protein
MSRPSRKNFRFSRYSIVACPSNCSIWSYGLGERLLRCKLEGAWFSS